MLRGRRGSASGSPISSHGLLDQRGEPFERLLGGLALWRREVVASPDPAEVAAEPPERALALTRRLSFGRGGVGITRV